MHQYFYLVECFHEGIFLLKELCAWCIIYTALLLSCSCDDCGQWFHLKCVGLAEPSNNALVIC